MTMGRAFITTAACLIAYLVVAVSLVMVSRRFLKSRPDMTREEVRRLGRMRVLLAIGLPEILIMYAAQCAWYGRLILGPPGLQLAMSFAVLVLGGLAVGFMFVAKFGPRNAVSFSYLISMLIPVSMALGKLIMSG